MTDRQKLEALRQAIFDRYKFNYELWRKDMEDTRGAIVNELYGLLGTTDAILSEPSDPHANLAQISNKLADGMRLGRRG